MIYVFQRPELTMTTVTVTTEVSPRGKTEGDSVLYGSSSAHIIEETEYVKKVWGHQTSYHGIFMMSTSMDQWALCPHPCNA